MGMSPLIAMIGPQEMWPILVVVLLLFGAKKLPELARGMGEGMREFKHAVREVHDDEPAAPAAAETKTEEK